MESTDPSASGPAPLRFARLHAFIFRRVFNLWPCIRGSGGRIVHLAPDFTRLTVRLPLNWRTRNAVGTIFGGSMMAATDPMYMLMLQRQLGRGYVVWDKGSAIRFKRPALRTLFADFEVSPATIAQVRAAVAAQGEADFTWPVRLADSDGVVHAELERTLYVADKAFYKRKQEARTAARERAA